MGGSISVRKLQCARGVHGCQSIEGCGGHNIPRGAQHRLSHMKTEAAIPLDPRGRWVATPNVLHVGDEERSLDHELGAYTRLMPHAVFRLWGCLEALPEGQAGSWVDGSWAWSEENPTTGLTRFRLVQKHVKDACVPLPRIGTRPHLSRVSFFMPPTHADEHE